MKIVHKKKKSSMALNFDIYRTIKQNVEINSLVIEFK